MRRKSFEGMGCSLAGALELIGDGWSMLILRDLMIGLRRFDDLQSSLDIATDTLAARLKTLETQGLITRRAYQQRPLRYDYVLTPKGASLGVPMIALTEWGERWGLSGEAERVMGFADRDSGRAISISAIDSDTGKAVPADQVRVVLGPGAGAKARWRADMAKRRAVERRAALGADGGKA
jgi:DNA-binding HxlR family transcriptional regulator